MTFTLYVNNPVYWHVNVLVGGGPEHSVNSGSICFYSQIHTLDQQECIYCSLALQLAEQNESFWNINFLRSKIYHWKTQDIGGEDYEIKGKYLGVYKS